MIQFMYLFKECGKRSSLNMLRYSILSLYTLRFMYNVEYSINVTFCCCPKTNTLTYLESAFEPITDRIWCFRDVITIEQLQKQCNYVFISYDIFFHKVPNIEPDKNYIYNKDDYRVFVRNNPSDKFEFLIDQNCSVDYSMFHNERTKYNNLFPDSYIFGRI